MITSPTMLGIILQWNHLVRILGKEESPSTQCSEGDLYWAPPVQWGWPLLSPSTQCTGWFTEPLHTVQWGWPLLSPSTQCSEGDLYWAPPHSAVTFTEHSAVRVTFTEPLHCSEGDLYWAPPHSAVRVTFTEPLHTVQWGWPLLPSSNTSKHN